MTKPFDMKELSARLKVLLRRGHVIVDGVLRTHGISLQPKKFIATKNGATHSLQPNEFALLEFFMRNPETVFTNDAIFCHVWHTDSDAAETAIRTCIKRLREKIDDEGKESLIETVHRVGYRFRK